jgi:transcriptional regulator with XRE-family HTH domain
MLHDVIKTLMAAQGMTYTELSAKSGVPIGTVNKILNGTSINPRLSTVEAIASALGSTVDEIRAYEKVNFDKSHLSVEVDKEKQELLLIFDNLSETERRFLLDIAMRIPKGK